MEQVTKTVENAVLLEAYREMLPQVSSLPLRVSGNSMSPFLVHLRDTVWLSAIRRPLRVGDVVLYLRDNGQYVLHRICRIRHGAYTMVGDAQLEKEPGIRRDQIFGLVIQAERNGKRLKPGAFWWEFFEKLWVRMVPLRPMAMRLATAIHRSNL